MKRIYKYLIGIILLLVLVIAFMFKTDIKVDELKEKYAGTDTNSQFFETLGMKIHYKSEGEGMPLVLLHGTSSSLFTWDAWTKILSPHLKIIRIDLPGFGLTGPQPNGDYSYKMYNESIHELLQYLKVDSCVIAGNSLGGYLAWNYAVEYPQQVKKLILLDAVAYTENMEGMKTKVVKKPTSFAFKLAKNPYLSWSVRWLTPRSLVKSSLNEVYFNDAFVTDSLTDLYFNMLRREGNRQAFIDNVSSRKSEGREVLLKNYQNPVLIQWGKQDIWIDISLAHWFSEILPNDSLVIYDNAGHVPMEEIPESTAKDALAFILQ